MKLEPEHDLYDPLVYDKEASDSQASYHDAESLPEHSPASAAAKEELDASSTAQQQTTGGPFEALEVLACGGLVNFSMLCGWWLGVRISSPVHYIC